MSATALFELAADEKLEPLYFPVGVPDRCRDCHRSKFPHTRSCGGGRPGLGGFVLCDDCACLDFVPGTQRSRWGMTQEYLAYDRAFLRGADESVLAALREAVNRKYAEVNLEPHSSSTSTEGAS